MTALVTGDWHLSSNPRDVYRHAFIQMTLPRMVEQWQPANLIVLGDLTDQKDCHNAELVGAIADYIHVLSRLCRVIILRGNHDCINPDAPFFGFLRHFDNVDFIYDSKVEAITGLGLCCFLAHTRDYKKSWARFNFDPFLRDPNAGFIFCHNTFEGAITVAKGHPLKGIPTDALPPEACVISGDVHYPQKLDQVTYVGAPYTVTFGDTYKPRVLLIESKVRSKGPRQLHTQSLPCHGPQKFTVEIPDPDKLPDIEFQQRDMLKLRVHLKPEHYAEWPAIQAKVRKHFSKHGEVVCHVQSVKTSRMRLDNRSRPTSQTDHQLFQSFGKRRGLTSPYIRTGEWLMKKV